MGRVIKFGGKSSKEFNLAIRNSAFPSPEKKEMSVEIPFSSGELDFSYMNGEYYYSDRNITYNCFLKASCKMELQTKITAISSWLLQSEKGLIEDTDLDNYYFNGKCVGVTPTIDEEHYTADIDLTFKCDPYKYSEDIPQLMAWDDLTFDENGYINPSKITVTGAARSFILKNPLNLTLPITVSFEKLTSGVGVTAILNGTKYKIYSQTADEFMISGFELVPGDNTLTVTGRGTLTLSAKERQL